MDIIDMVKNINPRKIRIILRYKGCRTRAKIPVVIRSALRFSPNKILCDNSPQTIAKINKKINRIIRRINGIKLLSIVENIKRKESRLHINKNVIRVI